MFVFLFVSLLGSTDASAEEVSAGDAVAEYVSEPRGGYPVMAEQTGAEADCRIRVLADEKGRPVRADIDAASQPLGTCPEPFRTQAIYTTWRSRLAPVVVDGAPTAFTFVQSVAFSPYLQEESQDAIVSVD